VAAPLLGPPLVSIYPISIGGEARSIEQRAYKVEQRLSQPSWSVPAALRAEQPSLPEVVLPGPNNPLGNYAMILDNGGLMIHGTNRPSAIGTRVSRGGISMYPEDIELLINRVTSGTPVRIVHEPIKHGYKNGALYLEFRKPQAANGELNLAALVNWMSTITTTPLDHSDWQRVQRVAAGAHGIAMPVIQVKGKPRPERGWWLQLNSYKTAQPARALINKIEPMEVPLIIKGCYDNQPCKVMAGPFKDKLYIEELRKKIKWVTGVKGSLLPYQEEDDFQLPQL
jgi:L,D-transpeptidase ErfK/SrfK